MPALNSSTRAGSRDGGRSQNAQLVARARPKAFSIGMDVVAFLVGVTLSLAIPLVGQLPAGEVIMLLSLPVLTIVQARHLNRAGIRSVFVLLGLWLVSQLVADLYRQTAFADWTRGNAAILFFAIDLAFITMLISRSESRKLVFIIGFATGALFFAYWSPTTLIESDPWKFGYSTGANLLAVLAASCLFHLRRYLLCAGVLLVFIAANLMDNFRSPVLLLLIAIALALPIIPERIGRLRILPRAGTKARVGVLALLALAAAGGAFSLVQFVTASGFIDEDSQAKNQSQLHGGFLLAGRPEIVVSSRAVLEHPLIGWGSWAKDYKYVEMLSDFQAQYNLQTDLTDTEEDSQGLIPAHSHLMGAWIWAGIFGAVFWMYVLRLAFLALLKISAQRSALSLFYVYLLVIFLWDIFFSPFQGTRRATEAFLLVVIVDSLGPRDFTVGLFRRFSGSGWTRLPLNERHALIQRHRKARSGNSSELQTN